MTANIATDLRTGQAMAFTAETPAWWDTLGTSVKGAQTFEGVLQAAHLDWTVYKAPLYTQWKSGLSAVEDFRAVVRLDTKQHLGVVGKGYELLQNRDLLSWTEALIETG